MRGETGINNRSVVPGRKVGMSLMHPGLLPRIAVILRRAHIGKAGGTFSSMVSLFSRP